MWRFPKIAMIDMPLTPIKMEKLQGGKKTNGHVHVEDFKSSIKESVFNSKWKLAAFRYLLESVGEDLSVKPANVSHLYTTGDVPSRPQLVHCDLLLDIIFLSLKKENNVLSSAVSILYYRLSTGHCMVCFV